MIEQRKVADKTRKSSINKSGNYFNWNDNKMLETMKATKNSMIIEDTKFILKYIESEIALCSLGNSNAMDGELNCSNYNTGATCDTNENCFWDLCYGGYYGSWSHCCRGGTYQVDNSYCEELTYIPGDINGDGNLNIADVILMVNLILNYNFNEYADMNQDSILNIIDIIELVNRILET